MSNVKKTKAKSNSKAKTRSVAEQKDTPKPKASQDVSVEARPDKLSTAWSLLIGTSRSLKEHWAFWLLFSLLFTALNLVLVHNFGTDPASIKAQLSSFIGSNTAATSVGTYALLVASNTSGAAGSSGVYQYLLLIISSLAAIWALRQFRSVSSATVRLRDALYEGMRPLIPFVLILLLLSVELFPIIGASTLLGIVAGAGVARTWVEQMIFFIIFIGAVTLSCWLLVRTLFAMYIVTLPGMTPVNSLRESVQLVRGFQLSVLRKLFFLLALLVGVSILILVPIIMVAPAAAQGVLFVLTIIAIPFIHTYLYNLYRELLG